MSLQTLAVRKLSNYTQVVYKESGGDFLETLDANSSELCIRTSIGFPSPLARRVDDGLDESKMSIRVDSMDENHLDAWVEIDVDLVKLTASARGRPPVPLERLKFKDCYGCPLRGECLNTFPGQRGNKMNAQVVLDAAVASKVYVQIVRDNPAMYMQICLN